MPYTCRDKCVSRGMAESEQYVPTSKRLLCFGEILSLKYQCHPQRVLLHLQQKCEAFWNGQV